MVTVTVRSEKQLLNDLVLDMKGNSPIYTLRLIYLCTGSPESVLNSFHGDTPEDQNRERTFRVPSTLR